MSDKSMTAPDLRSLLRVSVPLMLTAATEGIMLFADRAFLSHHSVEAMNGASATFMATAVFVFFGVAIAAVAEVLAGQYNGEGRQHLVGRPVWQMLWFSAGTWLAFIPIGLWGGTWLIPESLHSTAGGYFAVICFGAPLWAAQVALAGFFAATGRSSWLTPVAIVANLANVGLDWLLIFGAGPIPELGATGAALATVTAQSAHVAFLLWLFLRPAERRRFGTGEAHWSPAELKQAIRVGLPNAISNGVEITAWALIFRLVSQASAAHLTVLSTVTAVNMLLGFLNHGLKQGVVAIASNLIGAQRFDDVRRLMWSGAKLQLLIGIVSFIPLVAMSQPFLGLMGPVGRDPALAWDLKLGLICMWGFIMLDGLVWVFNGALTAGGDTRTTMWINISTAWLLAVTPIWLLLRASLAAPWMILLLYTCYAAGNLSLHCWRFRAGRWRRRLTSS